MVTEPLVSLDANNLMVFTKNRVDGVTKGCLVPKTPGVYSVSPQSTTLNSGGLITGGTYNMVTGKLYLVGYTEVLQLFVWASEGFNTTAVFSGTNIQTQLSSLGQEQAEAISFVDENSYLVTSESFSITVDLFTVSDEGKLISFTTSDQTLGNNSVLNSSNVVFFLIQ